MMKKEEELTNKKKIFQTKTMEKTQLFLLHFGGGSCYSYDFLRNYVKKDFEFIPLELPGRGKRYDENLIYSKKNAVEDYTRQIMSLRNKRPYLIYGHSMGATLGLSVTKQMEESNDAPTYLIVSGNAGPGIKDVNEKGQKIKRYLMSDSDFKEELKRLGGIPNEVLENEELFGFFNPIMRADFEVLEKDGFLEKGIKLTTPVRALMGSEEKYKNNIHNWSNYTTNHFDFQILKGNHFFIHDHPRQIAKAIEKSIEPNLIVY